MHRAFTRATLRLCRPYFTLSRKKVPNIWPLSLASPTTSYLALHRPLTIFPNNKFQAKTTRSISTTSDMGEDPDFIVSFFGTSTTEDSEGRTLNDILRYNNQALEYNHDYIQLLFPLPEPSPFNPDAPLITPSVRVAFLSYTGLRERLILALERMLQFYGFGLNPSYKHPELASLTTTPADDDRRGKIIGKSANFDRRARASWLKRMDHNHLRLTRMIRSLRVLGLEVLGVALWKALVESDEEGQVSSRSKMFWQRAAIRGLWLPPSENDDKAAGVHWLREKMEETQENKDGEEADISKRDASGGRSKQ